MQDEGATYDTGSAVHHLTLYRHPQSGALVFGAGTCQWGWGLDGHHDGAPGGIDLRLGQNCYSLRVGVDALRPSGDRDVQQATLNLFADCGVWPSTPQPELTVTAASTDAQAPTVGRTATWLEDEQALIGLSADRGGGVVAAVEVSLDEGRQWRRAEVDPRSGAWRLDGDGVAEGVAAAVFASLDRVLVQVRVADDSGNLSPDVDVELEVSAE